MSEKQTEAQRLADELVQAQGYPLSIKAAQELRRLDEVNEELLEALKAMVALDEDQHQRFPGDEDVCQEVQQARAAIAKAEATK